MGLSRIFTKKTKKNPPTEPAASPKDTPAIVDPEPKSLVPQTNNPESTINENDLKDKRKEAYIDYSTQRLLRSLLDAKTSEILPTYDPSNGFRYATIESILKESKSQEIEELLERLYSLKILEKKTSMKQSPCAQTVDHHLSLYIPVVQYVKATESTGLA